MAFRVTFRMTFRVTFRMTFRLKLSSSGPNVKGKVKTRP